MTRFERELSGSLGDYWKHHAEDELSKVKADLDGGRISIDDTGVARNSIGRVLMDDMLEKVLLVSDRADAEATRAARSAEVDRELAEYRITRKPPCAEDLTEMQAAFAKGTTVIDVITGKKIRL